MQPVLAELMAGVIDYAGLFPPARLSMDDSVEHFLRYKAGPESTFVDRFVCAAGGLPMLAENLRTGGETIRVSVVGSGGADLAEFENGLELDASAMSSFLETAGHLADIECFEAKVPFWDGFDQALRDLEAFRDLDVFVEIPISEPDDRLAAIAQTEWMGAKGRTGGLTPEAIPSSPDLAGFLQQVLDLELQFKLTAGLHEPLRHFDNSVGAKVHGFLNIAAAGMLHLRDTLSRSEIARVLDVEQIEVAVTAQGLKWGDQLFELRDVRTLRSFWCGIGSCSVDEPIEGLAKLGLMAVKA